MKPPTPRPRLFCRLFDTSGRGGRDALRQSSTTSCAQLYYHCLPLRHGSSPESHKRRGRARHIISPLPPLTYSGHHHRNDKSYWQIFLRAFFAVIVATSLLLLVCGILPMPSATRRRPIDNLLRKASRQTTGAARRGDISKHGISRH